MFTFQIFFSKIVSSNALGAFFSLGYFPNRNKYRQASLVFPIYISFYFAVSPVRGGAPTVRHTLWSTGEVMSRSPRGTPGCQKLAERQELQCRSRVRHRGAALDLIRGLNRTSVTVEHRVCVTWWHWGLSTKQSHMLSHTHDGILKATQSSSLNWFVPFICMCQRWNKITV